MSRPEEIERFYRIRVPDHFNRTLESQERAVAESPGDAESERILDEMRAVRTTIVVEVDDSESEMRWRYVFEIERGRMSLVENAERPPFLVLSHSLTDFEPLRRECGDSLLGFLGSLAGLGDEMRLTARRVRSLRELAGGLVFELTGPDGFALGAHFGAEPASPAAQPRARIRIDEPVFSRLRSGEIEPQDAFLDGLVDVEGDMEMAIGLALAAVSPD